MSEVNNENEKITITKERRVHAIVKETVEYEVSKSEWNEALEQCDDDVDDAFEELKSNGKAERFSCEIDMIDVIEEHESSIDVD